MNSLFESIAFENAYFIWHLAVLLPIWFIGLFWEVKKQKPRRVARIIALSMVLISLYVMHLSPFILKEKPEKSALLLSQNIPQFTLDSLLQTTSLPILQQNYDGSFKLNTSETEINFENLPFSLDTAFVYGYLPHLNPAYYSHRQDMAIKSGLRMQYPKSIAFGDSLKINIENLENRALTVSTLIGTDSLKLDLAPYTSTSINYLPKTFGYLLAHVTTNEVSYNFAIAVEKTEQYVMQILAAAPDFEWKFFADYLKSKGHSVYQKSQVSRERFKSSFLNWDDSLKINRGVADQLKVLFCDAHAWVDLGPDMQRLYLERLQKNHGSLIIRTNLNSKISLNLDKSKSTNIFSTSDILLESESYKYLQFSNLSDLEEVTKNGIFRKVLPDIIYGVINFQNSFQLELAGKREQYEQLWAPIFDGLIRKSKQQFFDKTKWAVQYQPFFFRHWFDANTEKIAVVSPAEDTLVISSRKDELFYERNHFMFYPQLAGWHYIKLQNKEEVIPFFVHPEAVLKHAEFLTDYNNDYLNYLNFDASFANQNMPSFNRKPITIWFFVMFLLSIAYLWIEDKIT